MLEFMMPLFIPAVGALIAWLLDLSRAMILLTAALVLIFQFAVICVVQVIIRIRRRYHAIPDTPPCRCAGSLKRTRRGGGYRCPHCNRTYRMAGRKDGHVGFVEKLDSGYTLAYLKSAKWGRWEADIPLCRCGSSIKSIGDWNGPRRYICSSCSREYCEISESGLGIRFKERVDSDRTIPYMKSVRWDIWEADTQDNPKNSRN
jgi:transposase-like protein